MGKIRIFFWCATANDARRALVLGGEFGFSPCIAGAWNIGAAAEELAAARAEVILSIGVPKPKYEENNDLVGKPKDKKKKKKEGESAKGKPAATDDASAAAKPEGEAAEAKDEPEKAEPSRSDRALKRFLDHERTKAAAKERKELEKRLRAPAKLAAAGVPLLFCTGSRGKAADLIPAARLAVANGLDPEIALAALTGSGAPAVGIGRTAGSVTPGAAANLVIFSDDPLAKDSKIEAVVVEGWHYSFAKKKDKDEKKKSDPGGKGRDGVLGTWTVEMQFFTDGAEIDIVKDGDGSGFKGTFRSSRQNAPVTGGTVDGKNLEFTVSFEFGDRSVDVAIQAELDGDTMTGTVEFPEAPEPLDFKATKKQPGGQR